MPKCVLYEIFQKSSLKYQVLCSLCCTAPRVLLDISNFPLPAVAFLHCESSCEACAVKSRECMDNIGRNNWQVP